MGVLEWLLQAGVIALLGAALPYVLRLERELRALRADRTALESSAAELSEATRMAEAASLRLRASAETAGRQVAEKLAAAEPLRDDLQFLVERAESMADRLDGLVRHARGVVPTASDPLRAVLTAGAEVASLDRQAPQEATPADRSIPGGAALSDRPVLQAVIAAAQPVAAAAPEHEPPAPVAAPRLGVVARPETSRAEASATIVAGPETAQARSRAERELLRALLQAGPSQGAAA